MNYKKMTATILLTSMTVAASLNANAEALPAGSKIGFSTPTLASEFFMALDEELHSVFEENGYEVVTISYEGNAAQQVADLENLASMGCDAITLFTMDEIAISDALKKCLDEGIKIYPNQLFSDPDTYSYCLGQDEFASGSDAAKLAVDWIEKTFPDAEDGSVEVCVVSTTMTEAIAENTNGMVAALESCPKVKIDEVFDAADAMDVNTKAQEFASIATAKYPDCKVFMTYADGYAFGVNEIYDQVSDLDRTHFGIFTAGNSELLYEKIKQSETDDSLIRGTYAQSASLAQHIFNLMTGEYEDLVSDNNYVYMTGVPITVENIDEYYSAE